VAPSLEIPLPAGTVTADEVGQLGRLGTGILEIR
jgi:hypothetical protein